MKHFFLQPVISINIKQLARFSLLMLLTFSSSASIAHEYWIEADNYTPEQGDTVALSTHVGQFFIGDEVPNIDALYSDYSVITPTGKSPVLGSLATDPPAYIETEQAGSYIVGQRTLRSLVDMTSEDFTQYLNKQGLEFIIPKIDRNRYEENPITEAYSRCVKSIIQTKGNHSADSLSTAFGYTLEIMPLSNPAQTSINDAFSIQLLYESSPLKNTQVLALNKDNADAPIIFRTNDQGIASLKLPYSGVWMLNAVHIIPSKGASDWESFWANLTFNIAK